MSAETRKHKRLLRKQLRKERKQAFENFVEAIGAFQAIDLKDNLNYKEKFQQVWPAIKPTLQFLSILRITGEKFDAAANHLVIYGDKLYGNEVTDQMAVDFLEDLADLWDTVESVLEIVKIVVGDKVDKVIDKIIEIGDWLFE